MRSKKSPGRGHGDRLADGQPRLGRGWIPAALSRPATELTWFCKRIDVITKQKFRQGPDTSPYKGEDMMFLMSLLILILA